MMSMLLTDKEKARFLEWLNINIDTATKIIEQMENMGMPSPVVNLEKMLLAGYTIIANKLRDSEPMNLGTD